MKCEHSKCKKMCGDACFNCKVCIFGRMYLLHNYIHGIIIYRNDVAGTVSTSVAQSCVEKCVTAVLVMSLVTKNYVVVTCASDFAVKCVLHFVVFAIWTN